MPYLADQLTDQLISTLGGIASLQVPSLDLGDGHTGKARRTIIDIGKTLRVDDIVEATVLVVPGKDGGEDRVRVNARLIAAGTDSQIWTQQFERSLGETAALHAEIARAIATGLGAVVTPAEAQRLTRLPETNPAANAGLL